MKRPPIDRLRSQRAFTLTELILVFAILGLLSLILYPQVSLYVDKSMGLTALSDCKIVMATALSHNMTNAKKFDQGDLDKRMGLDTSTHKDPSGQKKMLTNGTRYNKYPAEVAKYYIFHYYYTRGGITIYGQMDILTQNIDWTIYGLDAAQSTKRIQAIMAGLKVTTTPTIVNTPYNI